MGTIMLERLPQTSQFEDQRRSLRPDLLTMSLIGRVPRGFVIILQISVSHGSTLSTAAAGRIFCAEDAAGDGCATVARSVAA